MRPTHRAGRTLPLAPASGELRRIVLALSSTAAVVCLGLGHACFDRARTPLQKGHPMFRLITKCMFDAPSRRKYGRLGSVAALESLEDRSLLSASCVTCAPVCNTGAACQSIEKLLAAIQKAEKTACQSSSCCQGDGNSCEGHSQKCCDPCESSCDGNSCRGGGDGQAPSTRIATSLVRS
jgi:hypothetical protein